MPHTRYAIACTTLLIALAAVAAGGTPAPWVNGDFALGSATWSGASTTSFGDADGDGDQEAILKACGDGTYHLARGVSKGVVPASTPFSFVVEKGELNFWSFRMILLQADNPLPYVNNQFYLDPTGTVQPDWFDDQVLAWEDWTGGPLVGPVTFDPVDATLGINIPGWSAMSDDERRAELSKYTHMTLVVYGCASGSDGGATLDDFAWVVG